MVLADIKVKANIYQNRVRIITSSMNPDSPSTTSCTCTEAPEHRQFWTDNQDIETRQLSVEIPTKRSRLFHLTRLPKFINRKDNQKKSTYQSSIKTDPSSTTAIKEFNYNSPKRRLRRVKGIQRNSSFTASPSRWSYISTTQTLHRDDHHESQPIQTD
jgi:hypothetical protein